MFIWPFCRSCAIEFAAAVLLTSTADTNTNTTREKPPDFDIKIDQHLASTKQQTVNNNLSEVIAAYNFQAINKNISVYLSVLQIPCH